MSGEKVIQNGFHVLSTRYKYVTPDGKCKFLTYRKCNHNFQHPKTIAFLKEQGVCFQSINTSDEHEPLVGRYYFIGSGSFNLAYYNKESCLVLKFSINEVETEPTDDPLRLVEISRRVFNKIPGVRPAQLVLDKNGQVIGSSFHYFKPKMEYRDRSNELVKVYASDEQAAEKIFWIFNETQLVMVDGYIKENFIVDQNNDVWPIDFGLLLETFNEDFPFKETRTDKASRIYWNFPVAYDFKSTQEHLYISKYFPNCEQKSERFRSIMAIKACLYAKRHGITHVDSSNFVGLARDFDQHKSSISLERLTQNQAYLTDRAHEKLTLRRWAHGYLGEVNENRRAVYWGSIFKENQERLSFSPDQRLLICQLVTFEVTLEAAKKIARYPIEIEPMMIKQWLKSIATLCEIRVTPHFIQWACWVARYCDSPALATNVQWYINHYVPLLDYQNRFLLPDLFSAVGQVDNFKVLFSKLKSFKRDPELIMLCGNSFQHNIHSKEMITAMCEGHIHWSMNDVLMFLPFVSDEGSLFSLFRCGSLYLDAAKTVLVEEAVVHFKKHPRVDALLQWIAVRESSDDFNDSPCCVLFAAFSLVTNAKQISALLRNKNAYVTGDDGCVLNLRIKQLVFSSRELRGCLASAVPKDHVGRYMWGPGNVLLSERGLTNENRLFTVPSNLTELQREINAVILAYVATRFEETTQEYLLDRGEAAERDLKLIRVKLDIANDLLGAVKDTSEPQALLNVLRKFKQEHEKKVPFGYRGKFAECIIKPIKSIENAMKPQSKSLFSRMFSL